MALGTPPGANVQWGSLLAVAQTPNANGCGVGAKPRAWSGLKPSWPCSTTVNTQPVPGWPSAVFGTVTRIDRVAWLAVTVADPSGAPDASTNTGPAKPCASIRL